MKTGVFIDQRVQAYLDSGGGIVLWGIDCGAGEKVWLTPKKARKLARKLIRLADECK